MGNTYVKPEKIGKSPYTRSGVPPPPTLNKSGSNKPVHLIHDPMSLELHMGDERRRTAGLSPAEREWRMKWIKDQHLHPDEPIYVDAVFRQLNPVRVLYKKPMDTLYKHFLRPSFGIYYGTMWRILLPKIILAYLGIVGVYYYNKYEQRGWEKGRGVRGYFLRPKRYAEEPEAQNAGGYERGDHDLAQYGFSYEDFAKRLNHIGDKIGETQRPW